MHAAVRPYATAGVALVAASVIAVTPLATPLADLHIPTLRVPVALTQATTYAQVFQDALANLQAIQATAAANPTPILTKISQNQTATLQALQAAGGAFTIPSLSAILTALTSQSGASQALQTATQMALQQVSTALSTTVPPLLQTAFGDLTSLNVEGAINNVLLAGFTALFPLSGLLGPATAALAEPLQNLVNAIDLFGPVATILANPLQNLVNVLKIPTNDALGTELIFAGLIGPLIEAPASVGTAIQGVIDAISGGNPQDILNAVLNAPAVVLGGVLNGGLGPDVGPLVNPFGPGLQLSAFFGGLLNQAAIFLTPTGGIGLNLPGTIPALQQLQTEIANALNPPAIPTATAAAAQLTTAAASNAPSALPSAAANTVTVGTTAPAAPATPVAANTVTANTPTTPNTGPAGSPSAAGANTGAVAKVTTGNATTTTAPATGTTTTAATTGTTNPTGGNKAAPGNGTKTTGGPGSSTASKVAAGTTDGSGHPPKHGK